MLLDRANVNTDQMAGPVVKKDSAEAFARQRLQKLLGHQPGKKPNPEFVLNLCRYTLPEEQVEELFQRTEKEEGYSLTVNLPN